MSLYSPVLCNISVILLYFSSSSSFTPILLSSPLLSSFYYPCSFLWVSFYLIFFSLTSISHITFYFNFLSFFLHFRFQFIPFVYLCIFLFTAVYFFLSSSHLLSSHALSSSSVFSLTFLPPLKASFPFIFFPYFFACIQSPLLFILPRRSHFSNFISPASLSVCSLSLLSFTLLDFSYYSISFLFAHLFSPTFLFTHSIIASPSSYQRHTFSITFPPPQPTSLPLNPPRLALTPHYPFHLTCNPFPSLGVSLSRSETDLQ